MEWCDSMKNLHQLAVALEENGDSIDAYFLEKPWKRSDEWKYLQEHDTLEGFEDEDEKISENTDPIHVCSFECSIDGYNNGTDRGFSDDVSCCLESGHKGLHQVQVNEEGF